MDARALLRQYVELQNEGLARGDFARLLALFHPDAELAFDGIAFGPFRGWESIRQAFVDGPPRDRLLILDEAWGGERAVATYAWSKRPRAVAGSLSVESSGGLITRLVISIVD